MKTSILFTTLVFAVLTFSCDLLTGPGEGDGGAPGSFSASTGEGTSIRLSWSASQNSDGKKAAVSYYEIFRDNSSYATTSSTSYNDYSVSYAQWHSYYVVAHFTSGNVSSSSSISSGFCISSTKMSQGMAQGQQNATSTTNWYNTYVNKGWTYHFASSSTAQLFNYSDPTSAISGSSNSLTWTADRTGKVWIYCTGGLTAWYD